MPKLTVALDYSVCWADSMAHAQKKRKSAVAAVVLPIALSLCWYVIAVNYDYRALAGTYVFNRDAERCALDLRSDRTFTEELVRAGGVKKHRAHGIAMENPMFCFQGSSLRSLVKGRMLKAKLTESSARLSDSSRA
jgi:hypothetical protein